MAVDYKYIKEKEHILDMANKGYQLRNKTSGGQGKGKQGIAENKAPKGYHDGLHQGHLNARKEVADLFDKHLCVCTQSPAPNKNQLKALEKFKKFLNWREE